MWSCFMLRDSAPPQLSLFFSLSHAHHLDWSEREREREGKREGERKREVEREERER